MNMNKKCDCIIRFMLTPLVVFVEPTYIVKYTLATQIEGTLALAFGSGRPLLLPICKNNLLLSPYCVAKNEYLARSSL